MVTVALWYVDNSGRMKKKVFNKNIPIVGVTIAYVDQRILFLLAYFFI